MALRKLLSVEKAEFSKRELETVRSYYLHNHSGEFRQALADLESVRSQHGELLDSIAEIMVMRELPERRPALCLNGVSTMLQVSPSNQPLQQTYRRWQRGFRRTGLDWPVGSLPRYIRSRHE